MPSLPEAAEVVLLKMLTGSAAPQGLRLHLFINDHIPQPEDTQSAYEQPPAQKGYAVKRLDPSAWLFAGGGLSIATYPSQTFVFEKELGDVYGYFLTQEDGTLIAAERFPAKRAMINTGDSITVTPTVMVGGSE